MEQRQDTNHVRISGWVREAPQYSHTLYGEAFYNFDLIVPRLSGAEDVLPITAGERLLLIMPVAGEALLISGQLRSYNKQTGQGSRLIVTIFARTIEEKPADLPCVNEIALVGYVCKPPVYRTTPFLREITDLLLAVNRSYHKSDYLPVITWGRNARFAAGMNVGDQLRVAGRVQSREYQKNLPDGGVQNRVAYEVSASQVERME